MKVTSLDKKGMQQLRIIIEDALKKNPFGVEGVNFTLRKGSYNPDGKLASFQLEMAIIDESGKPMTEWRSAFSQLATSYGFELSDLDKEIVWSGGRRYTVAGILPRAKKMPIVLQEVGAKEEKLITTTPAEVLKRLGREVPVWLR